MTNEESVKEYTDEQIRAMIKQNICPKCLMKSIEWKIEGDDFNRSDMSFRKGNNIDFFCSQCDAKITISRSRYENIKQSP